MREKLEQTGRIERSPAETQHEWQQLQHGPTNRIMVDEGKIGSGCLSPTVWLRHKVEIKTLWKPAMT